MACSACCACRPRSPALGWPALLRELAAAGDLGMWLEVTLIVRELGWRMREIERTSLLRAGLLSNADLQVMQEVVTRLSPGEPIPA